MSSLGDSPALPEAMARDDVRRAIRETRRDGESDAETARRLLAGGVEEWTPPSERCAAEYRAAVEASLREVAGEVADAPVGQTCAAPTALDALRRALELLKSARVLAIAGGHTAFEAAYREGLEYIDAAIQAEQERVSLEHLRHGSMGALVYDGN